MRLAFPRRVYTQSHFDYTIDVIIHVFKHRDKIPPTAIVRETKFLRHFSAHLEPRPAASVATESSQGVKAR